MEDCTITTQVIGEVHHTFYSRNGVIVAECRKQGRESMRESWYRDGVLHREGGPAEIWYLNGQIRYKMWYYNGKLHRLGEAAVKYYDSRESYEYWNRGDPTRTPYKNDMKTKEQWYLDGKLHRENGPAEICYAHGKITNKVWFLGGKKHRVGGPAETWYEYGKKVYKCWYQCGKRHRVDGPAIIWYADGQKISEYWYRNDKLCPIGVLASMIYHNTDPKYYLWFLHVSTKDIDEFRDIVKGDAIHEALRALPAPIRQAITPHYCYQ